MLFYLLINLEYSVVSSQSCHGFTQQAIGLHNTGRVATFFIQLSDDSQVKEVVV